MTFPARTTAASYSRASSPVAWLSSMSWRYAKPPARDALGRAERAQELGDRVGAGLELARLRLGRALELRLEAAEPLLGVAVLRLRTAEVRPDQLEVLLEPREVLAELRAVGHYLARVLLDLEALEAEDEHEQVSVQRGGRHGNHVSLERVGERARGST
jgi:hypothetical protein